MMKKRLWAMLRVRPETRWDLEEIRLRLERARDKGQLGDVPLSDRGEMTIDTVIRILIERDKDHAMRSRSNSVNRNPSGKRGEISDDLPGQGLLDGFER